MSNALREEYRKIRNRSHARSFAEFDAAVRKLMEGKPSTPALWVIAARIASFPCRECAGTGKFITGTVNGVPKGPGGEHFRCGGKGMRNDADERRNYGYDMHRPVYL